MDRKSTFPRVGLVIGRKWNTWESSADLAAVPGLRETIHRAQTQPLINPKESENLRRTVLETFAEILEIYLNDNELRWRCDLVSRTYPQMPMQAVFRAIEIEIGVNAAYLKKVWYGNRRKAQVQEIVTRKLRDNRNGKVQE
ncbi:hypothetical protein [Geothrix sp. PMB-07]|uniref:hypothetical protein n=1 Tax=Geothrix sp. PMB-07 TaxID=3068640 RepID=UPI002741D0CE|nr:hypothetical protein [Geothrix sp. PMB-07]WLT30073.1 hypothetical protein Q9293_10125 [Geothrix sp. PMB-07]